MRSEPLALAPPCLHLPPTSPAKPLTAVKLWEPKRFIKINKAHLYTRCNGVP